MPSRAFRIVVHMTQDRPSPTKRSRAISIDIDGVLHPTFVVDQLPTTISVLPHAEELGLMRWVHHLAELLADHPDVFLLVHSSWRKSVPEREIRQLLAPVAAWYGGITPSELERYESILEVMQAAGIDDLLALDDDPRQFPPGWRNLVLCDPELGLSERSVQERIRAWLVATQARP